MSVWRLACSAQKFLVFPNLIMGSAVSGPTRAYTVENTGNVIDISDNVVKRIKSQLIELGKVASSPSPLP